MKESNMLEALLTYIEKKASKEEALEMKEAFKKGIIDNPPKVAIIGKSGVGKTSTINNLFSANEFVSDVFRGTSNIVKKRFPLKGGLSLDVFDMPGLGEDIDKDIEFEAMYREILPQSDIIIYILEALDGSFEEDLRILKDIVLPSGENNAEKIIIALNKVDMIGNNEGIQWEYRINRPNPRQKELIEEKLNDIQRRLTKVLPVKKERIVCYSALKKYQLLELMGAIASQTKEGWKFIVTGNLPKSWVPDIPKKYKEMAKELGILTGDESESYTLNMNN